MKKIWHFLKPSFKKILIAVIIWLILWTISYFYITKCFIADCMGNGHMTSCCNSVEVKFAELVYRLKISFPAIAYLVSCKLVK
jgi:hypothetical protein